MVSLSDKIFTALDPHTLALLHSLLFASLFSTSFKLIEQPKLGRRSIKRERKKEKKKKFRISSQIFNIAISILMEDYYYTSSHVPAFGSWDWNSDLPFTECFETARQAGLLRYSYSDDRDLYVSGDLYENDVVTPAMIVVPRRRRKAVEHLVHGNKDDGKKRNWKKCEEMELEASGGGSPTLMSSSRPTRKPMDEDLYKISPHHLLYTKNRKKGILGFFSSCLLPICLLRRRLQHPSANKLY